MNAWETEVFDLLGRVRRRPDYAAHQAAGKRLAEVLRGRAVPDGWRPVRAAVLSNSTVDPIRPYLELGCLERRIMPSLLFPGYNQAAQQILREGSDLYAFDPDVCFLHLSPEGVDPSFTPLDAKAGTGEALVGRVQEWARAFRSRSPADLVVSNFASPARFPYLAKMNAIRERYRLLNAALEHALSDVPGCHVLDFEGLTILRGKALAVDPRLRHHARMEMAPDLLAALGGRLLSHLLALKGLGRKLLVLDLDGVLWGGVLGEDGPNGIHLGPHFPGCAFVEFQESVKALREEGIVLAVCSKNEPEDIFRLWAEHPAMVLRRDQFAAVRIGWRDKAEAIEEITAELNLGLESAVFVDDSPAEREQMRRMRPQVLTPEWPSDPERFTETIENLPDFFTVHLTEEDAQRGRMYADQVKRESLRSQTADYEDYLRALGMEVGVDEAADHDLPRVVQLFQKTNQFNLTGRRYSAAEIEAFSRSDRAKVYVLRNRDAFGDNGLVGVALLRAEPDAQGDGSWLIDSFLMSCRVLGRTLEFGFLEEVLRRVSEMGVRWVVGEFIPSSRNSPAGGFYDEAGFEKLQDCVGTRRWWKNLEGYRPRDLPWIRFLPVGGGGSAPLHP